METTSMKVVIIVPDGMCDRRYLELGNLSPAEYARTPSIDKIVQRGRVGLARTMYPDLPLGSLVGLLGILGYRPHDYFPLGRSVFEARALGIQINLPDLVCRCNIVRVSAEDVLLDFTSAQISDQDANAFLEQVSLPGGFELHHDLSYRNVLVCRDWPLEETHLALHEPHENMGSPIHEILPRYQGQLYQPMVDLMMNSRRGEYMLWPWGQGRLRAFPEPEYRFMIVTALSFLSGLAMALGGQGVIPPGATGYLDSDLGAKFKAAVEHLDELDVCLIHCNAPDEEAHIYNMEGKVQAIEQIDAQVVAPMLEHLEQRGEPYRLWLIPDHYTVCYTGRHLPDLIPYAVVGYGMRNEHGLKAYSEMCIADHSTPWVEAHQVLPQLLHYTEAELR
jgi:2,3-bisphosphoglycerate-independent phosphoglycerate mutase